MSLGGNLTYPKPALLINNLTAADLGVFTDTANGSRKVLQFKKIGYGLPAITGKTTVEKSTYRPAIRKGVLVELSNVCPCEECGFEYNLSITKMVQQPGVNNSVIEDESRDYGGRLAKVQECTNGIMAAADLLAMEDDILEQIAADDGTGNDEGAIVDAYRAYLLTFTQADLSGEGDAVTLTYLSSLGVSTAVTLNAATAELNACIINDNTTVDDGVRAIAASATSILIIGLVEGDTFTLSETGDLVSSLSRYIYLVSNNDDYKFQVSFDKGFATVTGISLFTLNVGTVTTTGVSVTWGNGSWTTATAATTIANLLTELNSDISASGGYAGSESGADSTWITIVNIGSEPFDVKVSRASTVTITENVNPLGRWESMTSDDVFRYFANKHFDGMASNLHYKEQVVDGGEYWKLTFKSLIDSYGLEGASHGGTYEMEVTLFILDTDANFSTDIFLSSSLMSDAPTSPDRYLGDLIDAFVTSMGTTTLELPTSI